MFARKSLWARGVKFVPDVKSSDPRFCSFRSGDRSRQPYAGEMSRKTC